MKLTTKQKQKIKGKAHGLKPIVFIGQNGFTENISNDISRCLDDYELIKIRIQENDRNLRRELFQTICDAVSGTGIQLIGKIGVIYKKKKD